MECTFILCIQFLKYVISAISSFVMSVFVAPEPMTFQQFLGWLLIKFLLFIIQHQKHSFLISIFSNFNISYQFCELVHKFYLYVLISMVKCFFWRQLLFGILGQDGYQWQNRNSEAEVKSMRQKMRQILIFANPLQIQEVFYNIYHKSNRTMRPSSSPKKRISKKMHQSNDNSNSSQGNKSISKKSSQNENVCAACLFQISIHSDDCCSTECNHHYHEKCLEEWLKQKNTCCLCRQKISKYSNKLKGQVTVPDRPARPTLFQLLMSLDMSQRSSNLSEIIFFNGDLNQPWIIISSNQNSSPRPRLSRTIVFDQNQISSSSSEMIQQNQVPSLGTRQMNQNVMQEQNQVQIPQRRFRDFRLQPRVVQYESRMNSPIRQQRQSPIVRQVRPRPEVPGEIPSRIFQVRKSKRLQQKRNKKISKKNPKQENINKDCKKKRTSKQKIDRKSGTRRIKSS